MYSWDHEWLDSTLGHPWGVGERVTDVLVVRFSKTPNGLQKNSQAEGGWLHSMSVEYYLALTWLEKKEFADLYGQYQTLIHLKYGEIVGIQGWDTVFVLEDVIEAVSI